MARWLAVVIEMINLRRIGCGYPFQDRSGKGDSWDLTLFCSERRPR